MANKQRRAQRPEATSWDKLDARGHDDTLHTRDVHNAQQLDRSRLQPIKSNRTGVVVGTLTGVLVFIVTWVLYSLIAAGISSMGPVFGSNPGGSGSGTAPAPSTYYIEETTTGAGGAPVACFRPLLESGQADVMAGCYDSVEEVPVPEWYVAQAPEPAAPATPVTEPEEPTGEQSSVGAEFTKVSAFKLFLTAGPGALVALIIGTWTGRRVAAANLMNTTSDINQNHNDQHIALPEEIQRGFDWFPDAGAHSAVQVSSVVSHMMLKRKGLPNIEVTQRAEKDIYDEDGVLVYYAGEPLTQDVVVRGEDGKPLLDSDGDEILEPQAITKTLPIIDEAFGQDLFQASGLPREASLRTVYDTTKIPYNPDGSRRDKLAKYATVADLIKNDWTFPEFEVQRPAGAYMVDTAPVNTMVLAITRAGKGQTYIEPVIDIWSREKNPSNMVINDPKGELLVKNYVPLVMRGFEPVQFNLINAMKTDIYNPLGMAADAAREGDFTKCALYIENIGEVFFPLEGGEDPVWPNAANNAFKRAAYGLIDFHLEEERELRAFAADTGMSAEALELRLDDLWGKVTLYNSYQLFVQLTAKKRRNPEADLEKRVKAGEFEGKDEELALEQEQAVAQSFLWEGKPEADLLTLYFNASQSLPRNEMRTLVANAHNALVAMAGAEKMMSSVYGIAITGMSFFTDPRISTLTSGKPSQNTDLAGLSFPRRLGVRFAADFLKRDHLIGMQAVWSAYSDPMFSQPLGPDFEHTEIIGRVGWARYNFKGIFPTDDAWLKLELLNPQSNMLVRTFYFHFRKSYQLSLNGRHFVIEPVTNKKIVKNGVLRELVPVRKSSSGEGESSDDRYGEIIGFKPGEATYPHRYLDFSGGGDQPDIVEGRARVVMQTMARYSESPKAVFLVTPPHLMKFAKLILILIKQLVDVSFDQSYMTKSNQKPLYRTRFMLDELGNLQSDGNGISGFETMLSIGLGQEQQFTLILQTLQQLRAVYGDDVDKIVQGNVSNIIFLKSTDDSMIETLEKMSGKTHRSAIESKSISQDLDKIVGGKTDGRVQYTMSTKEEPLISYNDMAFIAPNQNIVFRAGDAPVWNRNETIFPMSWRLFQEKIVHPGHEYSLQTIPTLSSALEFDVRMNQPDFVKIVDKRLAQAVQAADAKELFQLSFDYKDVDIERLDPDVYSAEVMSLITRRLQATETYDEGPAPLMDPDLYESLILTDEQFIEDTDLAAQLAELKSGEDERKLPIYAEGTVSRDMLVNRNGTAMLRSLDLELSEAYKRTMRDFERDRHHFSISGDGDLRSADGSRTYISKAHSSEFAEAARRLSAQADEEGSRVFSEEQVSAEDLEALSTVRIHSDFYVFLASLPTWELFADGRFDRAMAIEMKRRENETLQAA